MMRSFLKRSTSILFLGLATMTTLSVTPSYAHGGCSCGAIAAMHAGTRNLISAEHNETRTAIREAIEKQTKDLIEFFMNVFLLELVEYMKLQERQNSNYQQAQMETAKRVEDAAQLNNMNRLKDEFRAKAESGQFDPNPTACLLLDLFGGDGGGSSSSQNASAVTENVKKWVGGEHPAVVSGGAVLSKEVYDTRERLRGSFGSENASTDWGLVFEEPTVDYGDSSRSEVIEVITRNTLDTTPPRDVSPEEARTPVGIDRVAQLEERRARLGIASESIAMSLNMDAGVMTGSPMEFFKDMAEDTAYNREYENRDIMSELQQIEIATAWHYAPKGERAKTLANSAGMNEKAWLYEIHRIMSLNARINFLRLELERRDAVVNAAILATLNDDD